MTSNPFLVETDKPFVAILGKRRGYVQITTRHEVTDYQHLPDGLLQAAKDWAIHLEALGAKKVYWMILSEVVTHLHVHLYPRWGDDEVKGPELFNQRNTDPQPEWRDEDLIALKKWAETYQVHIINPL